MPKVERLMGPAHHVAFTQDSRKHWERHKVSVVLEDELKELEKFFELPIHQQLRQVNRTIREYLRANSPIPYPGSTFLVQAQAAVKIAEDLTFAYFASGLRVEEVHDV